MSNNITVTINPTLKADPIFDFIGYVRKQEEKKQPFETSLLKCAEYLNKELEKKNDK
ncbi:MAG: hypothetical protein HWN81_12030 [Candidatus Lokiarchaeota archaeon]|nr:hypothetical protein [Candidatus Lokiarchaeota archaeon]